MEERKSEAFIHPVPYLPGYLGLGWFLFQRSQFLSNGSLHATRGGSAGEEYACNVGDLGSVPGLGRSPGEANGNPLQYSGLEEFHGHRSLAGYSPLGCKELDMMERLTLSLSFHYWQGLR